MLLEDVAPSLPLPKLALEKVRSIRLPPPPPNDEVDGPDAPRVIKTASKPPIVGGGETPPPLLVGEATRPDTFETVESRLVGFNRGEVPPAGGAKFGGAEGETSFRGDIALNPNGADVDGGGGTEEEVEEEVETVRTVIPGAEGGAFEAALRVGSF